MIPGLDGIRAIGLMMVVDFHAGGLQEFGGTIQAFFVLSGFLITGILLRMKESLPRNQFFGKFYGRRFLRIFPLYYLYLFILVLLIWQSDLIFIKQLRGQIESFVLPQIGYSFTYTFNFRYASAWLQDTPFLTHFWTLSVEEQFYLIWPVLIFFTPKEKLKGLFLGIIIAAPIFRLATYLVASSRLFPTLFDDPYRAVFGMTFSHIDAFTFGAYITTFSFPQARKQLTVLAIALPVIGYVTQYFHYGAIAWNTFGYEFEFISGYKFVWGYTAVNYFFALFIQNVVQNGLFLRVLDHPILRYLGKISYGLYVYQYPCIWIITLFRPKYKLIITDPTLESVFLFVAGLALTVLVGSISYHLFEKPINDLKDRFFPVHTA